MGRTRRRPTPRDRRAKKPKRRPLTKQKRRPATKPKRRPLAKPKKRPVARQKPRPVAKQKRRPLAKPKDRPAARRTPQPVSKLTLRPGQSPSRRRARVSVFIGTSVDGYIARENGDLDWLEVPGDAKGEDYGYKAFVGEIDAVVMGRKTFEKVLSFKAWPYGKTPVFVLTTRPLPINPRLLGAVETMADRPREVVRRLARAGLHRLYLDGGRTIQGFLRAGVVDEITITRVPVLLGGGVPLFGALPADVRLRHLETRAFPSGLVQTTYEVRRERRKPQKGGSVQADIDRLLRSRGSGEPAVSPPTLPLPEATAPDAREDPPSAPAVPVEVDPPVVDAEPDPAVRLANDEE